MDPGESSDSTVPPARGSLRGHGWPFSVAEEVQRALAASRYLSLGAIRCDDHEGVVTLRGRAPTYYLKQCAQTIALRINGVEEVVNRIEVDSPGK